MYTLLLLILNLALSTSVSARYYSSENITLQWPQFSQADVDSGVAFNNIDHDIQLWIRVHTNSRKNSTCTYGKASIRQEFRSMTLDDRVAFTDAVTCLQHLPPQRMTSSEYTQYPGVKSRYDEYVVTHIKYAYNIHMTASFFAWHRFFIQQLETDLRTYCGYTGTLPYWNWQLDADAPQDSELLNGDAYSMGDNGQYVANRSDTWLGLQNITFPAGTGGGCVLQGPFSNYTVNMGPIDSSYGNNVINNYQYNPRCLVRDFNSYFSQRYNTYRNVTRLILNFTTIQDFQAETQGYNSDINKFGMHGGGHWLAGGPSTLSDFHSSPGDPLFFLHHAMVDKVWTIWQYIDITKRQFAISGTSTTANNPPSSEMKLNDTLPFGFVAEDQTFSKLMDTFGGPFCYRYE